MTKKIIPIIKLLFLVLILLVAVFSCKRDKTTERNDTEGNTSELSRKHQEQEKKQEQYDDESDFKVRTLIEGGNGSPIGVAIEEYIGNKKIIRIPPQIKSLPVISIGENAFYDKQLVDVTLPDSVSFIDSNAFKNNKLTSINLGNDVYEIGESAFENNKLTSVTIPDSVWRLFKNAFKGNQLTSITISKKIEEISENTFADNKLTSIVIPDNVKKIGNNAFANNQLTDVTINNKIEIIEAGTFKNNQLKVITIPDSVKNIEHEAFDENPLTTIIVTSRFDLYKNSFPNDFSVFFNSNNQKLGTYTWDGKSWSVVLSGYDDPKDFKIKIINGKYMNDYYDNNIAVITYYDVDNKDSVSIPPKIRGLPVVGIEEWLNRATTSITIPDSVIYIGKMAFEEKNLTNVTFGNNVKTIEYFAFYKNKLISVVIPDSVTYIGESAFNENKLTSVTFGKGVAKIDARAFEDNQLTSVVIPDSVTYIGLSAFCNNKISNLTIGNGVTEIAGDLSAWGAFENNQLTSVIIGKNVTSIGLRVFWRNPIKSITIPANVNLSVTLFWNETREYMSFPNNFDTFYNANGKKAGTYVWDGKNWK